ncbi:MAG: SDR family oxidoreductase, partial [Salaquimonas sp.]
LKDKVAIITGAQRGIGFAIAERFVEEGANVVLADIKNAEKEAAILRKSGCSVIYVETYVRDNAQVEALVQKSLKEFGHIDILVNNASAEIAKTFPRTTEEEWGHLMAVNLKGVFLCSRAVIPHVEQHGHGIIINVASGLGLVSEAGVAAYCASKGGVVMLSKAMAIDHGPQGIRVNSLLPRTRNNTITRRCVRQQ